MSVPQFQAPKKHKLAILVWCAIFPLITVLNIFLLPLMQDWPGLLRTFVITIILVPTMVYLVFPMINKYFFNWLRK